MVFSIIYASTRPDADEKISIGIIVLGESDCTYLYSERKLSIARSILKEDYGNGLMDIVSSLECSIIKGRNVSEITRSLDYLSRYSNNLVLFSSPREILIPYSEAAANSLFDQYVGN